MPTAASCYYRKLMPVVIAVLLTAPAAAQARDLTPAECPIVANSESGIYHPPTSTNYRMMLRANQDRRIDNRRCFKTKLDAQRAGYKEAKE